MPIGLDAGATNFWNYSDKEKDGFRLSITGDIVEIHRTFTIERYNQKTLGQIKRFDNGNPMENWELVIDCGSELGELTISLPKNNGLFEKIWAKCVEAGEPPVRGTAWKRCLPDMLENMNCSIATKDGKYGSGNPRPWNFRINGPRAFAEYRGFVDKTKEEQPQASAETRQAVETALAEMEANNPSVGAAARRAYEASVNAEPQQPSGPYAVYDEDIPF